MAESILLIDDEKDIRLTLGGLLADEGFMVYFASSGPEALERLEETPPSVVILDLWMGGSEQGFDVLGRLREDSPQVPVIVISGHGNVETAVKAVKNGAYDFIEKPITWDRLLVTVQRALSFKRLDTENRILKNKSSRPNLLVGRSKVMADLMRTIEMVAPTPAAVLIGGENGVGKELVAHTIHRLSQRADLPMIELNCAAIPEELVESELFGHEKGAFTGADRRRQGRFDLANHSTIFLDEIADMSLKTQAKILRILQERKFERVGGSKTISVDVRVIAASNKDLVAEIDAGRFRADLYYRLNVVPLVVPPLRERPEDVAELAGKFLSDCLADNNLGRKVLAPEFVASLALRPWPGNVRELKNTIERLAITTAGPVIDRDPPLPASGAAAPGRAGGPGAAAPASAGAAAGGGSEASVRPGQPGAPDPASAAPEGGARGALPDFGGGPAASPDHGGAPAAIPEIGSGDPMMRLTYREAKAEFERRYFRDQLQAHGNNITQTAEAVSLDRTSLHKKLKALGFKDWMEGLP